MMRKFILVQVLVYTVIITSVSCKKRVFTQREVPAPFPTVKEQRTALAGKPFVQPFRILDSTKIIDDLQYLASDACEGRKPGSAGHTRAVERILNRMRSAGLDSFGTSMIQLFPAMDTVKGKNIIGWLRGTQYPDKCIVISAHYDHLGKTAAGKTYYGADDNASGVACMLALATYFKNNPHPYSLIFTAFDKEETHFEGANWFVWKWLTNNSQPALTFNLNMDMIARSDKNEIFASGIRHYPKFRYVIDSVQHKTNVKLLMGHDGLPPEADWTNASDHFAFRERMIPHLYIGVEDHPDYHQTSDTYDKINYSRYIENCNMIAMMVKVLKP